MEVTDTASLKGLFSDLVRLEVSLWDVLDRRLRQELDLPVSNFEVMQVIDRCPNCRVYDIAQRLSITVGGTSKAVDRIEALGHCARRLNPDDRRSSIIELTAEGRVMMEKAGHVVEDELAERFDVLPSTEVAHLRATINTLLGAAGHGGPGAGTCRRSACATDANG